MRKTFTILFLLTIGLQLIAQTGFSPAKRNLDRLQQRDITYNQNALTSPGEVIWSEDFDGADWSGTSNNGEPVPGNAPMDWTIHDNTNNNFNWRWDTVGPRGIYTSPGDDCHEPAGRLISTTLLNGYMMLEADYFNTSPDCSGIYDGNMDCYFQYEGGVDLSQQNAVHLLFEQASRFCCTYYGNNYALFSISTDNGTTWNSINVSEASINHSAGVLGESPFISEFDITNLVAGQSNVWFRFHLQGVSHYYWLVDDVAFVVPLDNDIQLLDYWNDYIHYRDGSDEYPLEETYDFTEGFYEYPWFLVQEYKGFHIAYNNFGAHEQTNFVHNVELWKDGWLNESLASDPVASVPIAVKDTTMLQASVWPWEKGEYTFKHYPSTDASDENPSNDTLYRYMKVGDSTVRVVDFDKVNSYISPDDWDSFDEDGDGLGFMINIPHPSLHDQDGNADYYILDGASLYVASNNKNEEIGLFENGEARVVAGMYKYDTIAKTYTEQISSAECTLSVNDTNSIVYIPFAQDGTSEYVFNGGTYLVAFNMYGTWEDAFGRLQTWNIMNANNNVQKRSPESCVTVNATITDTSDVSWTTGEGPAFGFKLSYSDGNVIPDPLYITFIVKNTNGEFIEDAKVLFDDSSVGFTDSVGEVKFRGGQFWPFDYVVSYDNYDTIFGSGYIEVGDITINITMNPVGIFGAEDNEVSIYPNPSNGIFTIDAKGTYHIQIVDMSGKLVSEKVGNNTEVIDLMNELNGMYFVNIEQNNQKLTKRIIIQ